MATLADNFKYLSDWWEQRPPSNFCTPSVHLPQEMLIYGLCGLWRGRQDRIIEFLTTSMTRACISCKEVIRGHYASDFWLGNRDHKGTYYVAFVCSHCLKAARKHEQKYNEYAESFFLPLIDDLCERGEYRSRLVFRRLPRRYAVAAEAACD